MSAVRARDPFAIPIDVQNFLNALLLVAEIEKGGFGVHEITRAEEAWQIVDGDIASHGFVLALEDGRRVYLEYTHDPLSDGDQEEIDLVELAPGMERPDLSECGTHGAGGAGGVTWYKPHGIAVYLAAERRGQS